MGSERVRSNNEKRQFWQMAIEAWRDSGLSVSKFCKAEGLTEGTFYNWRKKLSVEQPPTNKQAVGNPSSFIQVAIPGGNHSLLELVLSSGNTLRIGCGADSKTLSDVLSILHREGLC